MTVNSDQHRKNVAAIWQAYQDARSQTNPTPREELFISTVQRAQQDFSFLKKAVDEAAQAKEVSLPVLIPSDIKKEFSLLYKKALVKSFILSASKVRIIDVVARFFSPDGKPEGCVKSYAIWGNYIPIPTDKPLTSLEVYFY